MIQGSTLRDAIISGANNITNQKYRVDELNVFPVPDGDTGTNMSMTISNAARELSLLGDDTSVAEVAAKAASALLRGARGNSGVILSLLFRGFSKGLAGLEEAGSADIARALQIGVSAAYKAVMKPTEGTILTVARLAGEHASDICEEVTDPVQLWDEIVKAAKEALDSTPELLPVLKKAGVVDAGGKGFLVICEGMQSVFQGKGIIPSAEASEAPPVKQAVGFDAAAKADDEIVFTYCTEFIVNKRRDAEDALKLRAYLESIGDCVVVVDDDDIIKVHVHTDNPGNALQEGLKFGMLTNMKIENMREQHTARVIADAPDHEEGKQHTYAPVEPDRPYGFVAVAAGEGIQSLFRDLGADNIVSGGQTMNPSTDDILNAIQATPAQTVFVLPNNKNIIMAAEQAVELSDRDVCVLQTRTIPQGLSAMLAFDPDATLEENRLNMTKAFDRVSTGQITFAARDSEYDGHSIKEGEVLALDNGKLSFIEHDIVKACVKLTRSLVHRDSSFITILYGADATEEQANQVKGQLDARFNGEIEVNVIPGGQPVYYFIISVE